MRKYRKQVCCLIPPIAAHWKNEKFEGKRGEKIQRKRGKEKRKAKRVNKKPRHVVCHIWEFGLNFLI